MEVTVKEEFSDFPENNVLIDVIKCEDVQVDSYNTEPNSVYPGENGNSYLNESYEVITTEPDLKPTLALPQEDEMNIPQEEFTPKKICKRADSYLCKVCKVFLYTDRWLYEHVSMHQRRMFYCPEGCQFFYTLYDLKNHIASHKSMWALTCDVCKKTFVKKYGLKNHMTIHFPLESHVCHICNKNIRTKVLLRKHFNRCHDKKYECSLCKKKFYSKAEVLKHMRYHNQEEDVKTHKLNPALMEGRKLNVFWCDLCEIEIFSEEWYNEHKLKHEKYKFYCLPCSSFFPTLQDLNQHVISHPPPRYTCDVCGKFFREKYLLRNHLTVHFPVEHYVCHICNKTYRNSYILKDHLYHVHNKKYKCNICKKLYFTPDELESHVNNHKTAEDTAIVKLFRYDDSVDEQIEEKNENDDKNFAVRSFETAYYFSCSACKIAMHSEEDILEHTSKHKVILFQCPCCNQAFNSKPELKNHLAIHDDTYHFKCDLCLRTFNRKPRLRAHIYLHFPEEYVRCDPCNVSFKTMSSYKRHTVKCVKLKEMRRETSKKNVECPICKKKFLWYSRLKTHMKIHETDKEYLCLFCLKAFTKPVGLRRHTRLCKARNNRNPALQNVDLAPYLDYQLSPIKKTNWSYKCDICGEPFRVKPALQNHIYLHFPDDYLTCYVCKKTFRTTILLKRHLLEVHKLEKSYLSEMTPESNMPAVELEHSCTICSKTFEKPYELQRHLKLCESRAIKIVGIKPNKSSTPDPKTNESSASSNKANWSYECDLCGKIFRIKPALLNHIYLHFPEEYLTCHVCFKEFTSTIVLKKHLLEVHMFEKSELWW